VKFMLLGNVYDFFSARIERINIAVPSARPAMMSVNQWTFR